MDDDNYSFEKRKKKLYWDEKKRELTRRMRDSLAVSCLMVFTDETRGQRTRKINTHMNADIGGIV